MIYMVLLNRRCLEIAQLFERQGNFTHCKGVIDAKHVMAQTDRNASEYYLRLVQIQYEKHPVLWNPKHRSLMLQCPQVNKYNDLYTIKSPVH